jgi:hypothetical protein
MHSICSEIGEVNWQLGDVGRNPSRLVLCEQLGLNVRFTPVREHDTDTDLSGKEIACIKLAICAIPSD